MTIAIDPGTEQSAYLVYDEATGEIREHGILANGEMLEKLRTTRCEHLGDYDPTLAIEMVASYGMAVGKEVFETVLWTGRFIEAWGKRYRKVYRQEVKLHLCGSARAKDSNIRQAILDRYPRTGGGATPQIGTKKQPGPLYGVSSHVWAALAVALTAAETRGPLQSAA